VVSRNLAKPTIGNSGYQFAPVIVGARRVRLPDRCLNRHQQIANSVIELGEQKSHAVFADIELRRLPSHFSFL
jgi:hypothetical protein